MPALPVLNEALLHALACPQDHTRLRSEDGDLVCERMHRFVLEQGVAIFTERPRREPVPLNMEPCPPRGPQSESDKPNGEAYNRLIDPFVNDWVVNTNGNLYWRVRGRLPRYPIPRWPFGLGDGGLLVDIGCSWGRWSVAAARAGFLPVGVDVHVDALAAARRVSRQLNVSAEFICGDAEHLPWPSGKVDCIFSYSVLQHLDKTQVLKIFREFSRVLKPQGKCLVQLPNAFGLLSILQQLKRGFRDARSGTFEMRYWPHALIKRALEGAGFSKIHIHADGFLSQNAQLADLDLLSPTGKLIVLASTAARKAAERLPFLARAADSLWIEAEKSAASQ